MVLAHLQVKLWVDKQDYHLVRAEVDVVATISVGLFLVRVAKGLRAAFEQTRVNDEVWLPRQVRAFASARLGLLKVLRIEQEISYSKCREFQAGSPVISQMKARQVERERDAQEACVGHCRRQSGMECRSRSGVDAIDICRT